MSVYDALRVQAQLAKALHRQADPLELQTVNPDSPAERLFASAGIRRNTWMSFMQRRHDEAASEARRCGSRALAAEANALTLWTIVARTRS